MSSSTLTISETEARTLYTFGALIRALSYPGQVQRLPETDLRAFYDIGEALLDLETSYFTLSPDLDLLLARRGAPLSAPDIAMYHFYPNLGEDDLTILEDAPMGSYECPDASATLIIGCKLGTGLDLTLRGPGIKKSKRVAIGGIPDSFWPFRERKIRYPLGWDVFLVAGNQMMALPRTTIVEVD